MNVGSSSSATATSEVSSASSNSQAKSSTSTKKSEEASFDKELKAAENTDKTKEEKTASKETEKTSSDKKASEKGEDKVKKEDSDDLMFGLNASVNFTDYKYHNESQNLLTKNIQELLNTKNLISSNRLHLEGADSDFQGLKASISYTDNAMEMSDGDALFFSDLVKNTDNMSMQSIAQQIQIAAEQNVEKAQKSAQVSSVLMEKLSESMKTNQPFRIDFDKDVSVIIKVNKDGSLMANFIPGDKAVEQYLKNNISFLRQRFDEQNLAYSDLNYSNSRQQQQEEQRRRNNKENK